MDIDQLASPDRDFRDVLRLAELSLVFRLFKSAGGAFRRAVSGSLILALVRRWADDLDQLESWQRVRLVGVLLLSAALTHFCLLTLVPARLAPALPYALVIVTALVAVVLTGAAPSLTAAWSTWKEDSDRPFCWPRSNPGVDRSR